MRLSSGSGICDSLTCLPWWASSISFSPLLSTVHGPPVKLNHFGLPKVLLKVSSSSFQSQESVERNDAAISGPLLGPHPALTVEDSVKVQLNALSRNDEPRKDHGVEVMYHFANAEGTLEGGSLPCYFGFPADLYHFGHFSLKFKSRFKELIYLQTFQIVEQKVDCSGQTPTARIQVQVGLAGGGDDNTMLWTFIMSKVARGSQMPCWLTDTIIRNKV